MTHGQTGAGEWATIKDSAMAYPDDKSMTKMGGNVHFPVMQTAYALARYVSTTIGIIST